MKLNIVPARTGLTWVKLGIKTFARQPLALGGLFFMFMGLVSVLTLVPVLGNVLALALLPAATLGLMTAAHQAADGRFPMPSVLASAFAAGKQRMQAMLSLGLMYAMGFMAVMGVSALLDGGQFARLYLGGGGLSAEMLEEEGFQQAMWVGMALYSVLAMLFWHAPALVHWHGVSPIKSLFFSGMACWRNKGAMLVFGLGWMATFFATSLVLSLVASVLGDAALVGMLVFPTVMLMAAMFFTSTYFSFKDSFLNDDGAPAVPSDSSTAASRNQRPPTTGD